VARSGQLPNRFHELEELVFVLPADEVFQAFDHHPLRCIVRRRCGHVLHLAFQALIELLETLVLSQGVHIQSGEDLLLLVIDVVLRQIEQGVVGPELGLLLAHLLAVVPPGNLVLLRSTGPTPAASASLISASLPAFLLSIGFGSRCLHTPGAQL
jgi:hypothetical protein